MIIIFLACIAEYGSFNNGSLTGALVFHDETWQGEVLLLPGGTKKVTGIDFGQAEVHDLLNYRESFLWRYESRYVPTKGLSQIAEHHRTSIVSMAANVEVLPTAGPIKDEEILKLLMTSAKPKKNKKKKAKEAEGAKDGAEA